MQEQALSDSSADEVTSPRLAAIDPDIHCLQCGYCLQGVVGEHCPECGHSLAGIREPAKIPWEQRREIGRFRAYWRTVWLVTFRNRRFCEACAGPVSYRDARLFQLVTILLAFLAAIGAVVAVYVTNPPKLWTAATPLPWNSPFLAAQRVVWDRVVWDRAYAEVWPVGIVAVCFFFFLAAATGVPSYFFHPQKITVRRQNSLVAMSHYACGPLGLAPVLTVLLALAAIGALAMGGGFEPGWFRSDIFYVPVVAAVVVTLLWWLNLERTARRTMPQVRGRSVRVALITPALWIALALLLVVGLPLVVLFVLMVASSLA